MAGRSPHHDEERSSYPHGDADGDTDGSTSMLAGHLRSGTGTDTIYYLIESNIRGSMSINASQFVIKF